MLDKGLRGMVGASRLPLPGHGFRRGAALEVQGGRKAWQRALFRRPKGGISYLTAL